MKKALSLLIIAGFITLLSAHSASKVEAKFDLVKKVLTIDFLHSVKNNSKHFITEVTVKLNGKEIIKQNINIQDDNKKGNLVYKITEAKDGDTFEINTRCNKGGKKGFKLNVAQKKKIKVMKK